jgi:hypothetical protein
MCPAVYLLEPYAYNVGDVKRKAQVVIEEQKEIENMNKKLF